MDCAIKDYLVGVVLNPFGPSGLSQKRLPRPTQVDGQRSTIRLIVGNDHKKA
jgi:hypothetical protein